MQREQKKEIKEITGKLQAVADKLQAWKETAEWNVTHTAEYGSKYDISVYRNRADNYGALVKELRECVGKIKEL